MRRQDLPEPYSRDTRARHRRGSASRRGPRPEGKDFSAGRALVLVGPSGAKDFGSGGASAGDDKMTDAQRGRFRAVEVPGPALRCGRLWGKDASGRAGFRSGPALRRRLGGKDASGRAGFRSGLALRRRLRGNAGPWGKDASGEIITSPGHRIGKPRYPRPAPASRDTRARHRRGSASRGGPRPEGRISARAGFRPVMIK